MTLATTSVHGNETRATRCRICAHPLHAFMRFGDMPVSNGFLSPAAFRDEYFYPMEVGVCEACTTFQVIQVPDRNRLYHEDYQYFASTSLRMTEHFAAMAQELIEQYLGEAEPFVVEVGSNDGITLRNFAQRGIAHLGVEPSGSVADVARAAGLDVMTSFFSLETARRIVAARGRANLCIATNTMHNIEDVNDAMAGIAHLLKPGGVFVQEDPYLGHVIENVCYDQIYAEHMYLWSVTSLTNVCARHGLAIFDAEETDVHGGCMRYFISQAGAREPTKRLLAQKAREARLGLDDPATYSRFRERCEISRQRLVGLLRALRASGKRVVGYGATAKSTTILNYCALGTNEIEFICDSTPAKQGRFSPGAHIPIRPPESFGANYPDYAVLFAWNHRREIECKELAFRQAGGKWIIPVRMVEIA